MAQVTPVVRVASFGDYSYAHLAAITAGEAIGVSGDPTRLHAVTINAAGSGITITLYDGTSTAGTVVAVITPVAGATYHYDVRCPNGLFVVVAGTTAGDITLSYL